LSENQNLSQAEDGMMRDAPLALAGLVLWLATLALMWSVDWRLGVAWVTGSVAFNFSEHLRELNFVRKNPPMTSEALCDGLAAEMRKGVRANFGDTSRWNNIQ
jgi:hypothetical protein